MSTATSSPKQYDKKQIMIIAGEASADEHAARLVNNIRKSHPEIRFSGMGGKKMASAGVELLVDSNKLAIFGLFEVLKIFKLILHAFKTMKTALKTNPPDLLILMDYAGFNLKIAKFAKKLGIKTLYYIGPQVWASRPGRVKKLRQRVDMMAVIFPFEVELYQKAHVPVHYVGHPLSECVTLSRNLASSLEIFGLDKSKPIVGLIPGSRHGELERLLPCILKSAAQLQQQHPDIQFILPMASNLSKEDFTPYLKSNGLNIKLVENDTYNVINCCDALICVSGTVTLEIALLEKPMVIIYRISNLTYFIARLIVKVAHIGLCNIVAGKSIVKELVQFEMTPEAIAAEISCILTDSDYRKNMIKQLAKVHHKLTEVPANMSVDKLVLTLLD